jgi:hypothetical protein
MRTPRALVSACVLAWAGLFPAFATAGVPVVLPAGEDAARWLPYFAVVDFELSTTRAGPGPRIELRSGPAGWEVVALTAEGVVQIRQVPAPVSARDREDLVSVAHSLLSPPSWVEPSWDELASALPGGGDVFESPLDLPLPRPAPTPGPVPASSPPPSAPVPAVAATPAPAGPAAGPPPSDPAAQGPASTATSANEPLTPPAEPSSDPVEPLTTASAPVAAPLPPGSALVVPSTLTLPAPPPRAEPWIRTGAAYAGRQGVNGGVGLDLAGGVLIDRSLRIGVEVAGMSPARIGGIPGDRTSGDIDVGLLLNYVAPTLGLMFGVQGGYGWRVFESEGAPFAAKGTAWFAPVIGWDIPLGRLPLRLEPYGAVRVDTRPIDITVQDSDLPLVRRGVVAWRGGLRVVFEPARAQEAGVRLVPNAITSSDQLANEPAPPHSVIHRVRSRH